MPTGYTDAIKKGITFKEYALGCARAFGALITMRDEPQSEPIPDEFQPSVYHAEALVEAKAELERLNSMSLGEALDHAENEYEAKKRDIDSAVEANSKLMDQYNAMLEQVQAWQSPTPEHNKLKEFMVEQIKSSIEFDGMGDYYAEHSAVRLIAADWLEQKRADAQKDIEYHTKHYDEEVERTNRRNKWVRDLRDSLEEV
ncbi:hypothetical protein LCGC14_0541500 [marine sediment metagenome]|uniref:Uncharacterized protein n=1 Tax=marine sediment metagenome TaxID=412755 RepID=A0A0F9UE69_9ZZZZ